MNRFTLWWERTDGLQVYGLPRRPQARIVSISPISLRAARLAGERPERVEIDPKTGKIAVSSPRRARRQPSTNGMKMASQNISMVKSVPRG